MYNYDPNSAEYREVYRRAEERVKAKVGFYWHLASYILVNGLLIVIYLITGPLPGLYTYPWFVWPLAGWGIGLLFNFLAVFVFNGTQAEEIRRNMIEEELRAMNLPGSGPKIPPDRR